MKENIERLFQTSKEHQYCTVTCATQDKIYRFLKCVQVDYLAEIEMYRIICERFDDDGGNYLAKYFAESKSTVLEIKPAISKS